MKTLPKGGESVKKRLRMICKKLYTVVYICLMVVLLSVSVSAASIEDNPETSITLRYPLDNVPVSFYKVADFSEIGKFQLDESFVPYVEKIEYLDLVEIGTEEMTAEKWRILAFSLESVIRSEQIEADFTEVTNREGIIICNGIEKGLYLLLSETVERENHIYTPSPVLVTVPNRDLEGNWNYQVEIDYTGKVSTDEKYDEYMVKKVWIDKDGTFEDKYHEEIRVDVFVKGELYETVYLNEDNNWQYVWENLPEETEWTVSEEGVPENYKVYYLTEGCVFYIANVYQEPEASPQPELPQTGQLWWPVPVLIMLGITFFTVGWTCRKAER